MSDGLLCRTMHEERMAEERKAHELALGKQREQQTELAESARTIAHEREKLAHSQELAAAETMRYSELESKLHGVEDELSACSAQLQQQGDALRDAEADKRALQASIDEQLLQQKHESAQAAAALTREEEKCAKVGGAGGI